MSAKVLCGFAVVCLLVARLPALAAQDDFESLLEQTGDTIGGSNFQLRSDAKEGLRLLTFRERLRGSKIGLSAENAPQTPEVEESIRTQYSMTGVTRPMTIDEVRAQLAQYESNVSAGGNQDVVAAYRAYRDYWAEVVENFEGQLDELVQGRQSEGAFSLNNIDSYRALESFTNDFQRQHARHTGRLQEFVGRTATLPDTGDAASDFAQKAAQWEGSWVDRTGETRLRVLGKSVRGDYDWRGGTLSGTLSDDGSVLTGTWQQVTADAGKPTSGGMKVTISDGGSSISWIAWYGPMQVDANGNPTGDYVLTVSGKK